MQKFPETHPKPSHPNLIIQPVHHEFSERETFRASVAFELNSARPVGDASPLLNSWLGILDGLRVAQDISQNRYGFDVRLSLRVRLMGGTGKARVIVVGHAEAGDADTARDAGTAWATLLYGQIPALSSGLNFTPIRDSISWSMLPSAPLSAMAVVRRETHFMLEDSAVYVRNALSRISSGGDLLAVLHGLTTPTVIDIQCTPTDITSAERQAAAESAGVWTPSTDTLGDHHKQMEDAMRRQFLSERMTGAGSRYSDFMSQASDGLYEVRVQLMTSGDIDLMSLAHYVGKTLFGPLKYEAMACSTALCDAHDVLSAPYSPRWAQSLAPSGLRRIRDVFTASETLMVTCPPLPTLAGLPGITFNRGKIAPLRTGGVRDGQGVVMGEALTSGDFSPTPVLLPDASRSRHTYLAGKTGVGKTTTLVNMALQDMKAGHGVAFIDPHGDAAQDLLMRVPPERADDVIYFDLGDQDTPLGFNIMAAKDTRQQDSVIREFIALLIQLYDPTRLGIIGPRFEQMVMVAMSIAFALKDPTLHEVIRALSDREFSRAAIKYVKNPVVRTIYDNVVAEMSSHTRSEIMDWLTSKFAHFLVDQTVRHAVTRNAKTMDFRKIMDERKILIVNLSKGAIGQDNAQFIGLLLLPQLLLAAFTRANQKQDQRALFCVYVDEFHNFKTPALQTALAEGRKYGLSLTLANQFVTQVDMSTRQAIFGNAGTIGAFRVGIEDSGLMERELFPVFTADDLMNLPSYQLALKLADLGEPIPPCLVYTRPLPIETYPEQAERIREQSRARYGMDSNEIEAEIKVRYEQKPEPADPSLKVVEEPKRPSQSFSDFMAQRRAGQSSSDSSKPLPPFPPRPPSPFGTPPKPLKNPFLSAPDDDDDKPDKATSVDDKRDTPDPLQVLEDLLKKRTDDDDDLKDPFDSDDD